MFTIEDYKDHDIYEDEKHALFWAAINEGDGTDEWLNPVEVDVHHCVDEDYDQFYPPHNRIQKRFDYYKEKKAWWCLDDVDVNGDELNLSLYGRDDNVPYRRI